MTVSEETVNRFMCGARIECVMMYDDAVHIQADNGALLTMTDIDGEIIIGIHGPDLPAREQLRDDWDADEKEAYEND